MPLDLLLIVRHGARPKALLFYSILILTFNANASYAAENVLETGNPQKDEDYKLERNQLGARSSNESQGFGFILLFIIGAIYSLVALIIACNEHFIPALGEIMDKFKIQNDVIGATFMSAGCFFYLLLANFIGLFVSSDDIGVGSMTASPAFNMLFVVGISAVFAKSDSNLSSWWPIFRDLSFFVVSILMLTLSFRNHRFEWFESFALLLIYGIYLIFMKYNQKIQGMIGCSCCNSQTDERFSNTILVNSENAGGVSLKKIEPEFPGDDQMTATIDLEEKIEGGQKNVEIPNRFGEWPKSDLKKQAIYIILFPIRFCLNLTLPDPRTPRGKRFFAWGFIGSVIWITIITDVLILCTTNFGLPIATLFKIPPEVIGWTFLARGSCIPLLISSVIVARKGLMDMAVAAAIGSNIFIYCVALPLPLFIYSMYEGFPISVGSRGMTSTVGLLLAVVIFFLLAIAGFRRKMNKCFGIVLILIYIVFMAVGLAFEYGILNP